MNLDVRSLRIDASGALWAGTLDGLSRLDTEDGTLVHYRHDPSDPHSLSHNHVHSLEVSRAGILWIATWSGLQRFEPDTERFTTFRHDPGDLTSVSNNEINRVYEDRTGTLWIGTWSGGVNRLDRDRKFAHFFLEPGDPASLGNNIVKAFDEDLNGDVWIGTVDGLHRFDPDSGSMTRYSIGARDRDRSIDNDIWSIREDDSGRLWVGTAGGLYRFDRADNNFTFVDLEPPDNVRQPDGVPAIYEDREGTLWLGTMAGLAEMRRDGGLTRYLHDPEDPDSLSDNDVFVLLEDSQGALWVGTRNGLNRFDRQSGKFARFVARPKDPASLLNDTIHAIQEVPDGNELRLWIATRKGLHELDRDKGTFVRYTIANGLRNDYICGLLGDDRGRLWLSTNRGLSRLDPRTGQIRNYDSADGVQANEFNILAYAKARTGELYFGGVNGFNVFHPDDVVDNPVPPEILLTDFQIFNQPVAVAEDSPLKKRISEVDTIELSHTDSVFTFEFTAIDYGSPQTSEFAYMMQGFDADWNHVGTRRFATYTNLDPGRYVFRVKGTNNDGVWNETGQAVAVVIHPPPWRTWWAYSLYAMLLLATAYAIRGYQINRYRLRRQLEREQLESEKLRELDNAKSRFFANISHEFRTPLTLIDGPVKRLLAEASEEDTKHDLELVARSAHRLSELITQLLELSRLESGRLKLHARPDDVVECLEGLVNSFESLATQRGIALTFEHDGTPSPHVYFDRDVVENIFVNLLSNAFKFTPDGGRITVSAHQHGGQVHVRVSDTGVGIPVDHLEHVFDRFYQVDGSSTRGTEGTGIGLALAKELTVVHRGNIHVESIEDDGTSFLVTLAVTREAFEASEIHDEPLSAASPHALPTVVTTAELRAEAPEAVGTNGVDDTVVLVVEDNGDMRRFIRKHLEPDYRVVEARDGRDGLAKATSLIPDLVVSDVMMQQMDGYELCSTLKRDERSAHIPVILLTAKASTSEKVEGLQMGADDYLVKPFDSDELLARVQNLIEVRRELRERFSRMVVLKPNDIAVSSVDEVFMTKVLEVVEENLEDEEFGVEVLGKKVGMSRSQVHRKLRALTNQSPSRFIRSVRLRRASELLKNRAGSVAEIACMVGFSSQGYFTKCFHEQFGCTPKEYAREADNRKPAS